MPTASSSPRKKTVTSQSSSSPVRKPAAPSSPIREAVTSPSKKKKRTFDENDPLNSKAKGINPLTEKRYSKSFKEYVKQWENLPVYKYANDFLELFHSNDVVILKSGTGSGKSVIIPKLVAYYYGYEKKIVMTTPKQITTQSSAEYAAETLDSPLGEKIGYTFKGSKKEFFNAEKSIIEYTTDGRLITKFYKDIEVTELDAIVIDEAHERNVNIDILFFFVRSAMIARKKKANVARLKLVIMSATIDESIFYDYFSNQGFSAAVIEVPGASYFEVESIFSEKPIKKEFFIPETVTLIENLHKKSRTAGDIIVFVATTKETTAICEKIAKVAPDIFCKELYSGIPKEDKELAVSKDKYKLVYPEKTRKLIIATNVAESSITVEGIKFVIDSGLAYKRKYNPATRFSDGKVGFVTKAQISQRKGRTGRTEPGVCFHMYTKEQYDALENYPEPDIQKIDLTENTLGFLLLLKNKKNVEELYENLLQPPSKKAVEVSFSTLIDLGVVNSSTYSLTAFGKEVFDLDKNITNDVFLSCVYANAVREGCLKEVMIIIQGQLYYSKNRKLFSNYSKGRFDETIGDAKEFYNFFFVNKLYDESNYEFHKLADAFNFSDHSVFTVKDENVVGSGENSVKKAIQASFCKSFENFDERICKMNKKKEFVVKKEKINFNNQSLTYRPFELLSKAKKFVFMDRANGNMIDFVIPCV